MNNKKLIVLGRVGVDLYACEPNTDLKEVTSFDRYVGGAGGNIAVQVARLSGHSILLTRLAQDPWGEYIHSYLKKNGVEIPTPYAPEGSRNSLAITEIKSQSAVLYYRQNPADHHLSPENISENVIASALGVILTGTALSGSPSREAVNLVQFYAQCHSVPIILDLDYRPGFKNQWEVFLHYRKVIEGAEILIGTEEEFAEVTHFLRKSKTKIKLNLNSEVKLADFFLKNNTHTVIIKRGGRGSAAYQREKGKIHKVEGGVFPVKLVKNFGAGDAFAGTFCYYFLKNRNLAQALKRAAGAAAIVVSRGSCTEAMPTEKELSQFIKSVPYKI